MAQFKLPNPDNRANEALSLWNENHKRESENIARTAGFIDYMTTTGVLSGGDILFSEGSASIGAAHLMFKGNPVDSNSVVLSDLSSTKTYAFVVELVAPLNTTANSAFVSEIGITVPIKTMDSAGFYSLVFRAIDVTSSTWNLGNIKSSVGGAPVMTRLGDSWTWTYESVEEYSNVAFAIGFLENGSVKMSYADTPVNVIGNMEALLRRCAHSALPWYSTFSYVEHDLVIKDDIIYKATAPSTNVPPERTMSTPWEVAATDKQTVRDLIAEGSRYITSNSSGAPFTTASAISSATKFYYMGDEVTPSVGDFAIVVADENHSGATARYLYSGGHFVYQYTVTNFSAAQQAAIDSGVTSSKVSAYDNHINTPHNKAMVGLGNCDNTADNQKRVLGFASNKNIGLSGGVTGSASWDGVTDLAINTSVNLSTCSGTFGGAVKANAASVTTPGVSQLRNVSCGTSDLVEGVSTGNPGDIYFSYTP